MPTNISEITEYTTPVVVPNDGELITGADRLLTAQALANRAQYLRQTGWGSRAATFRSVPLSNFVPNQFVVPQQYQYSSVSPPGIGTWTQLVVSAAVPLLLDLDLPPGVTLTRVTLTVDGDAGGVGVHGALPATMPDLSLIITNPNSAGVFTTDTVVDASPDVATYDGPHFIDLVVSRFAVEDRRHQVRFRGETGANSQAGLTVFGLQISWTAP
jgi:hypothetical protein